MATNLDQFFSKAKVAEGVHDAINNHGAAIHEYRQVGCNNGMSVLRRHISSGVFLPHNSGIVESTVQPSELLWRY